MRNAQPSRTQFFFWFFFIAFAATAGALLFFSQSLFLREAGVKASLTAQAKNLAGAPPAAITKGVGRILKEYLDTSKHTSRATVRVSQSTRERLSLDVSLPWAEVSAKKRKQRAELICRLGGGMLESAGARSVVFSVRVFRMRKNAAAGDLVGVMTHSSKQRKCVWKE